jgi:hypothetical protein
MANKYNRIQHELKARLYDRGWVKRYKEYDPNDIFGTGHYKVPTPKKLVEASGQIQERQFILHVWPTRRTFTEPSPRLEASFNFETGEVTFEDRNCTMAQMLTFMKMGTMIAEITEGLEL